MKILGIVFGLCLISTLAFADASGEIVAIDKDANGNIRVWTQYKVDNIEVESRYPKIDGKYVYCTRYSKQNFLGMTETEIIERIEEDLKSHSQNLIQKAFDVKSDKTLQQIRVEYNAKSGGLSE